MTRKLPPTIVAIAAILAVSVLQAQECDCPAKSGESCTQCSQTDIYVTSTAPVCHDPDCAGCAKSQCPECPACSAHGIGLDTRVTAACAAADALTRSLAGLPGTAGFEQEQSSHTPGHREQLAQELSKYLTSGQHDPEHVRKVLEMALDSAARTRVPAQAGSANLPLASGRARQMESGHPSAGYVRDDIQYFASATEYPLARKNAAEPLPRPEVPVISPARKADMELRRLKENQQSMQEMIQLIRKDMQQIAEDLSQLHVESRLQPVDPEASQSTHWRSMPQSAGQPARYPQADTVVELKKQNQHLQQQLYELRLHAEQLAQSRRVEQAAYQQPSRLQPRTSPNMTLTPARTAPVTISYYVGDLMEPPFPSATLKLMQFIKAHVEPASWTDSRMMQISDPSISLVITQTPENQAAIAELLRQVRIGARSYMAWAEQQKR